jgi:hypothetical protein
MLSELFYSHSECVALSFYSYRSACGITQKDQTTRRKGELLS